MATEAILAHKQFRRLSLVLVVLSGLLLWASVFGPRYHFDTEVFLPLHTAMHIFSLAVAWLVFAVGWNTHDQNRAASVTFLACGFFGVALADFGHTLSYEGMPDLVTPASPEKSINFSFASRSLAALALLVLAFTSWRPLRPGNLRYLFLFATIGVIAFVYWVVLLHSEILPRTYVPGKGLTPFKVAVEYALVALHAAAAAGFWIKLRGEYTARSAYLFAASVAMALSQAFNSLYAHPYDIHIFLSHAYRVVGYIMIYRGIFISEIQEPYEVADRLQAELRESAAHLRDMGARIQKDVEEERKRIAHALHDEMGQNLTALRMDADWIQRHAPEDGAVLDAVERMHKSIEDSTSSMRRIVADLRPRVLDDLGIAAAAKGLTKDVARRTGLRIDLQNEGNFEDLREETQTALYRMLQESLTNVARHANAKSVAVRLARQNSGVALTVTDDGTGFDPRSGVAPGSFGLYGLRERARQLDGSVSIHSTNGRGTNVAIWLPVAGGV